MADPGTELQDGIEEIATEIGETLTFHNVTAASYDPASGDSTTTRGDVSDTVTHFGRYKLHETDGSNILMGDAKCILPAKNATFTPGVNGYVTRDADGSVWQIMAVGPIQMKGTTAGWGLQLRKASTRG